MPGQRHRFSCILPALELLLGTLMAQLWPFWMRLLFLGMPWHSGYRGTRSLLMLALLLVSHRSSPASTLGTSLVSRDVLQQGPGLAWLVPPCLQMLPDALPAPTTLPVPTAYQHPPIFPCMRQPAGQAWRGWGQMGVAQGKLGFAFTPSMPMGVHPLHCLCHVLSLAWLPCWKQRIWWCSTSMREQDHGAWVLQL